MRQEASLADGSYEDDYSVSESNESPERGESSSHLTQKSKLDDLVAQVALKPKFEKPIDSAVKYISQIRKLTRRY